MKRPVVSLRLATRATMQQVIRLCHHCCGGAAWTPACQTTNKRHPSNRQFVVRREKSERRDFECQTIVSERKLCSQTSRFNRKPLPRYNDTVWRHRARGSTARNLRLPAVQISAGATSGCNIDNATSWAALHLSSINFEQSLPSAIIVPEHLHI